MTTPTLTLPEFSSPPTLGLDPSGTLSINAQPTADSTLTLEQAQSRQQVLDQVNAHAPALSPTEKAALDEYTSAVDRTTAQVVGRTAFDAAIIGAAGTHMVKTAGKFDNNEIIKGLRDPQVSTNNVRAQKAIAEGTELTRAEKLYTSGLGGGGLDPEKNLTQQMHSASLRAEGGVKNAARAYGSDIAHSFNSHLQEQEIRQLGKQAGKAVPGATRASVKAAGEEAVQRAMKEGSEKVAKELAEEVSKRAATAVVTKAVAGAATRTVAKAAVGIGGRMAGKLALGGIPVVGPVLAVAALLTDPWVSGAVRKGVEFFSDASTPDPVAPPEPPRTQFLPLCHDGNRDPAIEQYDGLLQKANVETFDYLPDSNWNINDLEVKTTPAFTQTYETFGAMGEKVEQLVTDTLNLYSQFQQESYVNKLGEARAAFLDSMGTLVPDFLNPSLDAGLEPVLAYADAWVAFQQANYNARVTISESNKPDSKWIDFSFGVTANTLEPSDFPDSPAGMLRDSGTRMERGLRALDEAGKTWMPPAVPSTAQVTGVSNSDAQKLASGNASINSKGQISTSALDAKSMTAPSASGFAAPGGFAFSAPSVPNVPSAGAFSPRVPTAPTINTPSGGTPTAPKAPSAPGGTPTAPKAPTLKSPTTEGLTPPKAPSADTLAAPKAPTLKSPTTEGLTPPKAPTTTTSESGSSTPKAPTAASTTSPTLPKAPVVDKPESTAPVVPQAPRLDSKNATTTTSASSGGSATGKAPTAPETTKPTVNAPTAPTTASAMPEKLNPANPTSPLNSAPLTSGLRGETFKAAPAPAPASAGQGVRLNSAPAAPSMPAQAPSAPSGGGGGVRPAPTMQSTGDTMKAAFTGGGEEKTEPAPPVDAHDPAANPEGAAGDARESTTITREGQTYEMGTGKAAKMAELFAPGDGSPGMSLREAAAAAGFKVPPVGFDMGTPVSPAELQPGDVVVGDGIEGIYIGNGLCLTERGVLPLSEVAIFTGENHGFFRLDGNMQAEDSLATGQKSSAEDDILKSAAVSSGGSSAAGGGGTGGLPGKTGGSQSSDPYDPKSATTTGRKMSVTGTDGTGSMPTSPLKGSMPTVPKVPSVD